MEQQPDPTFSSPLPILEYGQPSVVRRESLLPLFDRFFHFATTIALRVICFGFSAERYPLGPDFQRGQWNDYLGLIPEAKVRWPFYPLLLFAMYAAGATIAVPNRAIDWLHVRIGIFTGVILAFQYSFIQAVCIQFTDSVLRGSLNAIAVSAGITAILVTMLWVAGGSTHPRRFTELAHEKNAELFARSPHAMLPDFADADDSSCDCTG